ncbi:MAG: hypothetical protein Q4E65_05280 [Clostridia bacterium]|nr:hypothetical protein [Clostridia bacterium]
MAKDETTLLHPIDDETLKDVSGGREPFRPRARIQQPAPAFRAQDAGAPMLPRLPLEDDEQPKL